MEKQNCINGGAQGASPEEMLAVQQFLQDNYHFRRNMLNGKVEFLDKPSGRAERVTLSAVNDDGTEKEPDWRPLTPEALNSIIIRAKRERRTVHRQQWRD